MPRPVFRYLCVICGDSFALDGECPRCALALHDQRRGPADAPAPDPRVEAFVDALSRPPRRRPSLEIRLSTMALALGLFGLWHLVSALAPLGILLLGFAAAAAVAEVIDRRRRLPPAWSAGL